MPETSTPEKRQQLDDRVKADDGRVDLRKVMHELVTSAVNLRIVTMVGDATVTGSAEGPRITMPEGAPSAVTIINLIDGDITSCTSPSMVSGELREIRAVHEAAVRQGQEIVERNVRLLRELIAAGVNEMLRPPPPRGPGGGG
jgi:hypothetical protein